MSTTKPGAKITKLDPNDPALCNGKRKHLGGSQSDHWNLVLVDQAVQALRLTKSDPEARDWQVKATLAGLGGIGPKDEIEGMIAAQLIAAHSATMECYRRHARGAEL
jgi:hypothetical protein